MERERRVPESLQGDHGPPPVVAIPFDNHRFLWGHSRWGCWPHGSEGRNEANTRPGETVHGAEVPDKRKGRTEPRTSGKSIWEKGWGITGDEGGRGFVCEPRRRRSCGEECVDWRTHHLDDHQVKTGDCIAVDERTGAPKRLKNHAMVQPAEYPTFGEPKPLNILNINNSVSILYICSKSWLEWGGNRSWFPSMHFREKKERHPRGEILSQYFQIAAFSRV